MKRRSFIASLPVAAAAVVAVIPKGENLLYFTYEEAGYFHKYFLSDEELKRVESFCERWSGGFYQLRGHHPLSTFYLPEGLACTVDGMVPAVAAIIFVDGRKWNSCFGFIPHGKEQIEAFPADLPIHKRGGRSELLKMIHYHGGSLDGKVKMNLSVVNV